jgi:hypothetical protein
VLVEGRLYPTSTWPSPAARVLIGRAESARVNPVSACGSRIALGRRSSGVVFAHAIERGLLVGQGGLAGSRMIVVRPLRDRTGGLVGWLAAGGGRGAALVFDRYGNRRDVGLGPAEPVGKGSEAITVPIGVDGRLSVKVRRVPSAGERDVGALAGGVG